MTDAEDIDLFWAAARHQTRTNPVPGYLGSYAGDAVAPPAWSFGGSPEQADELLGLVLDGTKTATASALWDYEHDDEPIPRVGDLSIVLDGADHPRGLLETTHVDVVPFDQVDAEHADLEGEGDRTLDYWRECHEQFFRTHASHTRGFSPTMPVVLERFRVLYPR
ncbi:ASCH domain-containing protein [Aeromicrobium sp. A1-2]|uniref:ASCH domain-containing protein n=1 Tax=Aeromicrobium sp. A1-2 TaxID=2107713 RepID=UPI000E46B82C|nr:ASCH domain-containing protein [Aeromicrobium sp. A1-2]AXT85980.1 ASCH domain-containing protein [Aeromicrobium sp. A1-2]